MYWRDDYIDEEFVRKMKPYQRVNHFPASENLGRKNLLTDNTFQGTGKRDFSKRTCFVGSKDTFKDNFGHLSALLLRKRRVCIVYGL